jgi:hypothetical protein
MTLRSNARGEQPTRNEIAKCRRDKLGSVCELGEWSIVYLQCAASARAFLEVQQVPLLQQALAKGADPLCEQ